MLAAGALAAGLVELGEEGAHVGGRAHHLVGGGEIGPTAEAEDCGDLLPRGEQVEEDLLIFRVGAGVVGEKHALAQRGARGEGHDRLHVGRVGGEGDAALGVGLVAGDVIGGQAVELLGGGLDGFAAFLDVAAEFERKLAWPSRAGPGGGRAWPDPCRRRRGGSRARCARRNGGWRGLRRRGRWR